MISLYLDSMEYRVFDALYAVSASGLALRKMQPVAGAMRKDGYVSLGRGRLMHRVVASCWCERPEGATHVHHINGIKSDNRADNLEWVTPKQHLTERHDIAATARYIRTPETRAKLAAVRTGTRDSDETRAKKAAILNAVRVKVRPVQFQGVSYPSVSAAARAAGLHLSTFRLRHLSECQPVDVA